MLDYVRSLIKNPATDHFELANKVLAHEMIAMSGTYVDDYLTVSPPPIVEAFVITLRKVKRKLWRTSDPQ